MPRFSFAYATFEEGSKLKAVRETVFDPTSILTTLGLMHVALSREAFRMGGIPSETRWDDRINPNWPGILADFHRGRSAPAPHRFQTGPGKTLMDTGRGRQSIAFRVRGKDLVEVGTVLDYMIALHFGDETDSEVFTREFQDWLSDWLAGPGASWSSDLEWMLDPLLTDQRKTITHLGMRIGQIGLFS